MSEQLTARPAISFGCDPELFFANSEGQIIGAERVLPTSGELRTNNGCKAFILDGVQAELNPAPSNCRQVLAGGIAAAFKTLQEHLKNVDAKTCFDAVITVDKKELESLSERSRQFGCMPSNNFYDHDAKIKVDPAKYRKRSAGGHIHLGLFQPVMAHRERLVPIFDVLIGNTCVMLDRCPDAAERRKNYGRAGEYRLPKYGIEYRTLSNFWLRSYPLMSLVMGLARMSVTVLHTTLSKSDGKWWDAEHKLMAGMDLKKVQRAINTNDLALAKENWQQVRAFIQEHVPLDRGWRRETGIDAGNLAAFEYFLAKVETGGLEYWFPEDPMEHWCNLVAVAGYNPENDKGWESFLDKAVAPRLVKEGR